jgi:hypothetical protein
MSAPVVLSSTTQDFDTPSATHNVTMPATVEAGDLLIVTFCGHCNQSQAQTPLVTTPSGWTELVDQLEATGPWAHCSLYGKIADGTEDGTNVDFATVSVVNPAAVAVITRIQAGTYYNDVIANILVAAVATQSSGEPNPPSLNPSWTATDDTLWGAAFGTGDTMTVTGWPTNFSENNVQAETPDSGGTTMAQGLRSVAADSLDPGTFTVGSNEHVTITWAVRGITGGGRTTKNTRSWPLGTEIGMGWRQECGLYVPREMAA